MQKFLVLQYWNIIGQVNSRLMQFEAKTDAEVLGFAVFDADRQSQQ